MLNLEAMKKVHKACQELGKKKNNDYSGKIDPLKAFGVPGIAVRLTDKIARLGSLTHGTKQKIKDESIRDTLMDVINYSTYAIMMIDGNWE